MTATARFGGATITFTSYGPPYQGFPDELGTFSPLDYSQTVVPGCRHRPYRSATRGGAGAARAEYPQEGIGVATTWWESTCPPAPAALAAQASDIITIDVFPGLQFRIVGNARPVADHSGRIVLVTFLSERQTTTA